MAAAAWLFLILAAISRLLWASCGGCLLQTHSPAAAAAAAAAVAAVAASGAGTAAQGQAKAPLATHACLCARTGTGRTKMQMHTGSFGPPRACRKQVNVHDST